MYTEIINAGYHFEQMLFYIGKNLNKYEQIIDEDPFGGFKGIDNKTKNLVFLAYPVTYGLSTYI